MKDDIDRFDFSILRDTQTGEFTFAWQNDGVPDEIVITFLSAFLKKMKNDYQNWFESGLGEYSGDD